MRSRGEYMGYPGGASGPDPAPGPTAAAGDPREAPAPTAQQTASEEPSGGGHGEETPKTSNDLLFLTNLLSCHDNRPLYWCWMGMGQLGTARHGSVHRGHWKTQGPARPASHGTAASHAEHLLAASCSHAMDAQPQQPFTAPAHMPGVAEHLPAPQTPRRKPRHRGHPAPGTVTGYYLHSVI